MLREMLGKYGCSNIQAPLFNVWVRGGAADSALGWLAAAASGAGELGECAHQDVDNSGLQGEQIPGEGDIDSGDGQENERQDAEEGEEVLPGRPPLLDRNTLMD
jgi:hypothetical protein